MLSLVFLIHIASLMPLVLQSDSLSTYSVIRLHRMTTVSPSSSSYLKKIADSSQNVMGKKGKLIVK